jgi:hypothetical protein
MFEGWSVEAQFSSLTHFKLLSDFQRVSLELSYQNSGRE